MLARSFLRHLLIPPSREELSHFMCDFTIINLPDFASPRGGCASETVIAINLIEKLFLLVVPSTQVKTRKQFYLTQLFAARKKCDADALFGEQIKR